MEKESSFSIVEINDEDLELFLAHLDGKNTEEPIRIGKYNKEKNEMTIARNGIFKTKIKTNHYKKNLIFKRQKNSFLEKNENRPTYYGNLFKKKEVEIDKRDLYNLKKLKTKVLTQEINLNKLAKARIQLASEQETRKALKMEKEDIKAILFEMFTEKPKMIFEEIQDTLDQPRTYLIDILEKLCNKKKEKNKFVYSLKNLYLLQSTIINKKKGRS